MSFAERPLDEWSSHVHQPIEEELITSSDVAPSSTSTTKIDATVWGRLPVLTIVQAGGLLLVSFANMGASSTSMLSNLLYWIGLATIVMSAAMRLISTDAARQERAGLVISTGLMLYLVKLIHSPFGFTYSDELLHLFNTNQILETRTLFSQNLLLPVSPLFPGLASVTAAIATLTGFSLFQSGAIVIGAARLLLVIATFLLAEQVTRSARVAGLMTLIFMCNSNFLYSSAQFSYESLSFPLVIGAYYLIARRERAGRQSTYMAYTMLALLAITAIVVTHHLSAYFMVGFLLLWWVMIRFDLHVNLEHTLNIVNQWRKGELQTEELVDTLSTRRQPFDLETTAAESPERGPEGLALFSFIVALSWLTYVAITTYGYISLVLSKAGLSLLDVLAGEQGFRQLFVASNGYVAPLTEQFVTLGSVGITFIGLPLGLRYFWQQYRHSALAWILATGAISYFAMLPLRLTSASWETGNRASVYFYLGLAFILALAVDQLWSERHQVSNSLVGRVMGSSVAFGLVFMTVFAGGVIAGWNPQLRFTQPLLVDTGDTVIETQGVSAANWLRNTVGPNHRIVSDEVNGRLMLAYGEQSGYVGRFPYVYDLLRTPTFTPLLYGVMQEWDLDYAVVDRREIAWDNMAGYFFDRVDTQGQSTATWSDPAVYEKFDRQPLVSRIMDTGTVVIYDVADLVTVARKKVDGEAVAPELVDMLIVGDASAR